ncbi:MAG: AAA family ATPase [Pirellulales bacterium]
MKLTGLKIDGFGVWSGLELSDLSAELEVFYGANEAGKTTLMQFVRSMLYGFSGARRARYLPPARPGRSGGLLYAAAGQQHYAIGRHTDEAGEAAVVDNGRGGLAQPGSLEPLLGSVDEATFNNVFCFGLREIQELGTLSDTQAADELYELALGVDRVSLVDVMRELETSRTRLLAPDERPSLVTQLLSQRERLSGEIDDLSQGTARYFALAAERDKLAGEISRLEAEVARFEKQGRELSLARALQERWLRRAEVDERLRGLGGFESLPDDALAQWDQLEARLARRKRRYEALAVQRRTLRERIAALGINDLLCRQALRLEALGEQQQWIASLETQVTDLAAELAELERRRAEGTQKFGIAAEVSGQPLSKRGLSDLRGISKSLHKTRHELAALEHKAAVAAEVAAQHATQLTMAVDGERSGGLTQALTETGELVTQLRKRVQIDQRLEQMSRREAELEEQSQEHLEKQILPTWVIVGVGGMFVLGCALVLLFLAGLVLPMSFSRVLGWPVGLIGVLAALTAALTKVWMEHSASRQLDTCHAQLHQLGQQIQQARAERDELDTRLPRGGGPLVARLQGAEKALSQLEELLPLEAKREAAEREVMALSTQIHARQAQRSDLKKRWAQRLAELGLPRGLRPRQVRDYARRCAELAGMNTAAGQIKEALGRRRAEYESLAGRISQAVADAGLSPRAEAPLAQLRACLAELAQQQSRLATRDGLQREIVLAGRRQKKLKRQARTLRGRRSLLLRAAGTDDALEFRRLALAQAEAALLRAERITLAQEIAAAIAGRADEEQIAAWLAAPHELGRLEAHVADARRIAAEHASQALERRGEMNEQLKTLVDDRKLAHKRLELGIVEKRLRDALDRWRIVATCSLMLEAVRAYYEREHQPPALQEASTYLARLTRGRYVRVWTPLGEHRLLVNDDRGQSLNVELLSRGTREQLFLALRLALISSYARRGVRLPLVLDDVLVNFDAARARAAAVVLRDFARTGHQLLIFTCHEHIARMFRQLKAEVRELPDNGQAHADDGRPSRRPRRARADVVPEPEPETEFEVEEAEPDEIDEPLAAPPPPAEPVPPPVPVAAPSPAPRVPPPRERRVDRVEWSAEEFEGELADRVRRPIRTAGETSRSAPIDEGDDDEDSEAA